MACPPSTIGSTLSAMCGCGVSAWRAVPIAAGVPERMLRRLDAAFDELLSPPAFDLTTFDNDGGYDELVLVARRDQELPLVIAGGIEAAFVNGAAVHDSRLRCSTLARRDSSVRKR